jgi:dihydrodipicolinate synthase/N-acetylneuraminate lyase
VAALMGRPVGEPRLPLMACSAEDLAEVRRALAGLDLEPRGW